MSDLSNLSIDNLQVGIWSYPVTIEAFSAGKREMIEHDMPDEKEVTRDLNDLFRVINEQRGKFIQMTTFPVGCSMPGGLDGRGTRDQLYFVVEKEEEESRLM